MFARSVALAVTLWWYYRTLVLSRSWQTPLALASGLAELGLAALGGGVGGAIREARAVAADLARPWAVAADPTITSGRQLYERLLLSLSCATSYTYAYGPLSGVVQFALFAPCEALAAIGRGPSLLDPFRAATLLCAWLLFHLGHQLAISALLHRYFSHRSFDAPRLVSLALGVCACGASQRGPLWWASTHRRHHRFCDERDAPTDASHPDKKRSDADRDPHSPVADGWLHAHLLWMTQRRNFATRPEYVSDWLRAAPELLFVDLCFMDVLGLIEGGWTALLGAVEGRSYRWATAAMLLKHGRTLGRTTAWHATFAVNSLCHHASAVESTCGSRNISLLSLASCGDSYHDNHHRRSGAARHAPPEGLDLAFAAMCAAQRIGLIHKVREK